MVDKSRTLAIVLFAIVTGSAIPAAMAADPPDLFLDKLAPFVWTGAGGNNTWENAPNWTAPIFPGDYPYAIPTFPNDSGRVDTNAQLISPSVGADFSGALVADRTVNIANGNVTVASLKMGGTGVAVTTNVTANVGNRLIFENQEWTDNLTHPGDVNVDPDILPEPIYQFNQGRALIWSTGTAGAGKENRITADIQPNDIVTVEGDRDLHLYGNIYEGPSDEIPGDPTPTQAAPLTRRSSAISSLLSGGAKLYIHGNVNVMAVDDDLVTAGTQERVFSINLNRGILLPTDPQMPLTNPPTRQGTVDISGQFVGDGWIQIGSPESSRLPMGNVILRADNVGDVPATPVFSGRIIMNRGNLVLANDKALGGGTVVNGNPNQGVGFNMISDNDSRVITNDMTIAQWQTVRGANGIAGLEGIGDHSLKLTGRMTLTNSRGFINLLPTTLPNGQPSNLALTIAGPQYGLENQAVDNLDHHRPYAIDGSGKTMITGGIHNRVPEQVAAGLVDFQKRGSGTVVIDYDETNVMDSASNYTGHTYVQGGNLHFATPADLPDGYQPNTATSSEMLSSGGAVGLDTGLFDASGVLTADGTTFLNMFNNSANLNNASNLAPDSFLRLYGVRDVITNRFDSGGLMLGAGDYNKNLNFSGSQGSNPLARAANMTLAAHEGGSTYTGTITPASASNGTTAPGGNAQGSGSPPTGITVAPDTYRLGGGSGTLTLPNNNQLVNGVGNRNLLVTNGGEVKLTGTHTYSGTTQIMLNRETTNEFEATRDDSADPSTPDPSIGTLVGTTLRRNTTLTVSTLANGGVASSIGNSSSAATNLVVQGSTLKYVGGAVSTDRLFTVGTAGGTIDASGTGALTFSSTSALNIDTAEDRQAFMVPGLPNSDNNEVLGVPGVNPGVPQIVPFDTSDLVTGMTIKDTGNLGGSALLVDDDSLLVITSVGQNLITVGETDLTADNASSTSPPVPWPGYNPPGPDVATMQFGPAPARFLSLTGSNTGNNTLNPRVTDASDIAETDGSLGGKGSVGIQKRGDGKWILTNANTYSGANNVDDGTLLINGTQTGTGLTTVANGAAFGGTGQIGGGLTMAAGSTFTATAVGGLIDSLNVLGNVDLSALGNILNVTGPITGTQTLLTYVGTLTGTFESTPGYTVNYGTLTNSAITIMATTPGGLIGDYNGDNKVDAADYTKWRDNLGGAGSILGVNRDPNNSGLISNDDYLSWKSHFGQSLGSGSFSSAAVPEPTSFVLLGMALVAVACSRRMRCR